MEFSEDKIEKFRREGFSIFSFSLRKRNEIRNMSEAFRSQIPSTIVATADFTSRNLGKENAYFDDSILDLVAFGISRLVSKYPLLNSQHLDSKHFGVAPNINIGIAFDSGSNLKVLSLNNSELKSLSQIQKEVVDLLELYESGKTISPEFFTPTLVISDLSNLGIELAVPTLVGNLPIIIAITQPKYKLFKLSCTFDHRVLDGRYISNFLDNLIEHMFNYTRKQETMNPSCVGCSKTLVEEVSLDPKNRGFIMQMAPSGETVLVCRVCFEGY
jgi:pyruvate dehydrogenase E2 component (dihydrolipoamide acetyltransferase)